MANRETIHEIEAQVININDMVQVATTLYREECQANGGSPRPGTRNSWGTLWLNLTTLRQTIERFLLQTQEEFR